MQGTRSYYGSTGRVDWKSCRSLLVIDDGFHLLGIFADGDLRQTLKASGARIFKFTVGEMCNMSFLAYAYV